MVKSTAQIHAGKVKADAAGNGKGRVEYTVLAVIDPVDALINVLTHADGSEVLEERVAEEIKKRKLRSPEEVEELFAERIKRQKLCTSEEEERMQKREVYSAGDIERMVSERASQQHQGVSEDDPRSCSSQNSRVFRHFDERCVLEARRPYAFVYRPAPEAVYTGSSTSIHHVRNVPRMDLLNVCSPGNYEYVPATGATYTGPGLCTSMRQLPNQLHTMNRPNHFIHAQNVLHTYTPCRVPVRSPHMQFPPGL
jgi:hypothetical protein